VAYALDLLYMALRNQRITNTSYDFITGDDGAIMFQASISDAGTPASFTRGEFSTI
jgi:hypothetical protein